MKKYLLFFSLFLAFSISNAQDQQYKNAFGFKSDNDSYLFYGQDRYYTNGLFIYYRFAPDQSKLGEQLEKTTWEFSAGQKLFNSRSGYSPDPTLQDRPFAGYLYAGAAHSLFYKNESALKFEAQVGVVGPSSLGEDGQEFLHDLVGFYELDGWQYQIKDDYAINLSAEYSRLLKRFTENKMDVSFVGGANLGTTFTGANAGVLYRFGAFNQLFNSASLNAEIGTNNGTKPLVKREFFFYAKPQISYIAYDATIKGSLSKDIISPVTFDTKPIVYSGLVGVNYSTPRFTADYSAIFKSKEVNSYAVPHQYGMISLYYRFN